MKIKDIITEAKMDPGIRKELAKKGYKFLGAGQDQDAFLAPNGTILKIFGTAHDAEEGSYSEGQQSFVDFATYCMKNPNNPFLPTFGGFERFVYNGKYYLQISCERLFDFNKSNLGDVAEELENLKDKIEWKGARGGVKAFLENSIGKYSDDYYDDEANNVGQLVTLVGGQDRLMMLAKAIDDLGKIAENKGYGFDLHSGNFMLGSDGEIVINDPFFTGTWR